VAIGAFLLVPTPPIIGFSSGCSYFEFLSNHIYCIDKAFDIILLRKYVVLEIIK
jgi:hypothetical protein